MTAGDPGLVWRGVVIAEGLRDPTLINNLRVARAYVTGDLPATLYLVEKARTGSQLTFFARS
jgi:hypothetical protein